MDDADKLKLSTLLLDLYMSSISRPNPKFSWKPYAGMLNYIDALEKIGIDFSKVDLTTIK